jgi:hypothetical protein
LNTPRRNESFAFFFRRHKHHCVYACARWG